MDADDHWHSDASVTALRVIIATTTEHRDDAFAVRIAVFVEEQGISREDELDADDAIAIHCVAYMDGSPSGAGRMVVHDGYGKFGRMAVLSEHRGKGLGAMVLEALEREGADRGLREFHLSAQLHAQGFYERCGYTAHSDIYADVGIPHVDMVKRR